MPNDGFWSKLCDAEVKLANKFGFQESYPLKEYQVKNILEDFSAYGITEEDVSAALRLTGGHSERTRASLQQKVNALFDAQ